MKIKLATEDTEDTEFYFSSVLSVPSVAKKRRKNEEVNIDFIGFGIWTL
jgi:hypothetical protein